MWRFRLAALWKPWFWQTLTLWCCSSLFASNLALLQHVENIASAWKALPLSAGCSPSFRYFWTSWCWMQLFRASQYFRDNGSAMPLASVFFSPACQSCTSLHKWMFACAERQASPPKYHIKELLIMHQSDLPYSRKKMWASKTKTGPCLGRRSQN